MDEVYDSRHWTIDTSGHGYTLNTNGVAAITLTAGDASPPAFTFQTSQAEKSMLEIIDKLEFDLDCARSDARASHYIITKIRELVKASPRQSSVDAVWQLVQELNRYKVAEEKGGCFTVAKMASAGAKKELEGYADAFVIRDQLKAKELEASLMRELEKARRNPECDYTRAMKTMENMK